MARSAPFQYGSEESASQKMCVSKLATTVATNLLHVAGGNLVLRRDLLHRAVLLQRLDRRLQTGPELLVGLAVVDPKRVRLREQIRDRELPGVRLALERTGRVLRQHGVGAADQELPDGVGVARIALQVHLRLAGGLEL